MNLVVDASVATKWFFSEPETERAERILACGAMLHAPDLLRIEVANAFWKHVLRGVVDQVDWEFALPRLERSVGQWHDSSGLLTPALKFACEASHPIYDFVYLGLARRLGAQLVTADRRFLSKAPPGEVISLQDWNP